MTEKVKYERYWVEEGGNLQKLKSDSIIIIHNDDSVESMLFDYAEMYMNTAYNMTKYMLESANTSVLDTFIFPVGFLFGIALNFA